MSIFTRLGKLIRANLNFGVGDSDKTSGSNRKNFQQQQTAGNSNYQQRPYTRNPQSKTAQYEDPELAKLYANMEVPYGADLVTVTRAWKRLLQKYHPDKHTGDPERYEIANQLVQELNRTYQELKKRLS